MTATLSDLKYPVYEPHVASRQEELVLDTLRRNDLTFRGRTVSAFEGALAEYLGVEHVLATCNGTAALCAAYEAAFGRAEQRHRLVAVSPVTYASTVSQLKVLGYEPAYIDCDKNFQMDLDQLERYVKKNPGCLTGVVVPAVYADAPDLTRVRDVCDADGIPLVVDAAEAFGCIQRGREVGAFGDVATYSFFANKVITTGEGGCLATDDRELYERAKHFSNLCTGRNYHHDGAGCNFRMAALPAAQGIAQLEEVDEIIAQKQWIAKTYRSSLNAEPVIPNGVSCSSEWMPVFRLPPQTEYEPFREACEARGVQTRPTFQPLHRMPGLEGYAPLGCPVAESLRGFILPCYPALDLYDLTQIIDAVNNALEEVAA